MKPVQYSVYAKLWAAAWVALVSAVLATVLVGGQVIENTWNAQYASIACMLALLMFAVPLMHALDQRNSGYGLSHVYHHDPITRYQLDDAIVSGLLTALSVRAAVGVAILGGLVSAKSALRVQMNAQAIDWPSVLRSPTDTLFTAIVVTLAASIITTMASLLSYDYSLRFDWKAKSQVRYSLRRKAHRLSVFGFYWLVWSLPAATALVDLYACLIATTFVFFVMWYYYFFSIHILAERSGASTNEP